MHRSRVDAFRHRAAVIIADPVAGSHVYRWLTLTAPAVIARSTCDEAIQLLLARYGLLRRFAPRNDEQTQNAWRATKVIRHGLWPMFLGARVAENPAAASFASMSASL
jgi:hypothetical protein